MHNLTNHSNVHDFQAFHRVSCPTEIAHKDPLLDHQSRDQEDQEECLLIFSELFAAEAAKLVATGPSAAAAEDAGACCLAAAGRQVPA